MGYVLNVVSTWLGPGINFTAKAYTRKQKTNLLNYLWRRNNFNKHSCRSFQLAGIRRFPFSFSFKHGFCAGEAKESSHPTPLMNSPSVMYAVGSWTMWDCGIAACLYQEFLVILQHWSIVNWRWGELLCTHFRIKIIMKSYAQLESTHDWFLFHS